MAAAARFGERLGLNGGEIAAESSTKSNPVMEIPFARRARFPTPGSQASGGNAVSSSRDIGVNEIAAFEQ